MQRRFPGLLNAILTFEKFPNNLEIFLKILNFYLKVSRFKKNEFQNSEIAVFFAILFDVCGQNLVFVSCKSTALQRFTWNNFFFTKTAEHDLSLTSITFDLGWPWVRFFRGCVELMPGEVLKISKRYSQPNLSYWRKTTRGPFGPPIRSRVKGKFGHTHENWVIDWNEWIYWFKLLKEVKVCQLTRARPEVWATFAQPGGTYVPLC